MLDSFGLAACFHHDKLDICDTFSTKRSVLVSGGIAAERRNGRCRMRGGVFYKRQTHGRTTLKAIAERKMENNFLRALEKMSRDLEEAINEC